MSWINKKELKINNTSIKNFSYAKGKCNLNFSLRTDVKDDLKDFLEILEVSLKEVREEIEK
jgi:hypothetical protein